MCCVLSVEYGKPIMVRSGEHEVMSTAGSYKGIRIELAPQLRDGYGDSKKLQMHTYIPEVVALVHQGVLPSPRMKCQLLNI